MPTRHTDVPLDTDTSGRFLPWLVALMVYLAAIALTAGMAMQKIILRWDQGLAGRVTIQVPPKSPGETETEAANRHARVLQVLRSTPGVRSAEALDPEDIADLLKPWLGEHILNQDLPLPILVAVSVQRGTPPDLPKLAVKLDEMSPGIVVDDHQRWLGDLLDLARTVETISGLVVLAVGLSAAITIIFVTRTGLAIHRRVIDLLHLIGAQDAYIARQFQNHAARLGLRGGVVGLALAGLSLLLVDHLLARGQSALLPSLSLTAWEWLILALLPVATAAVAMITARVTVTHNLARMP